MNQQDKPDEGPEKTDSEDTGAGEEGQTPDDAAQTEAAADGEKPADEDSQGEETTETAAEGDPEAATDEAVEGDENDAEADADATAEGADDTPDRTEDETASGGEAETAESDEGESHEDTDPETIDLEQALGSALLVSDGVPPDPVNEPAPEPEHAETDHEEEEHHRSLAGRVLTWLILLMAGGGLALWGGPKVAPQLPSGLGPVKAWLMPGALDTEAELAALGARLDARIDAVEQAAVEPPIPEEAIQAAIADLEGRVTPRLDDLADQVGAIDREAIEARLTQLETRVEGLVAQIESLAGLGAGGAELSEENLAQINAFSATVDGLRAELSTLADKQGALSQRIDDVAAAAQRRITEAEDEVAAASQQAEATKSAAIAQAAATTIGAALTAGEPYEEALAQLRANTDVEVPEALAASAASGVTPLGTLRDSFPDAAHDAIRASIRAKDDASVGGRLASFIEAQVASRSLTPQQGDSTDAILSRAEDALRRDNLAAAVSELESLSEPARAAMQGWISRAEARVAARSALTDVSAALTAGN